MAHETDGPVAVTVRWHKPVLTDTGIHLQRIGRTPYTLFYCGDGKVEEDGEQLRQIERVSKLLHQLNWRTSRITASESLKTRELLLEHLRTKSIDAVVSIKVLDEGIDVPACQSACCSRH